jgi:hypothetical protein
LVHHEMLTDGKHLFVEAAGLKDVINASRHGQLATARSHRPASPARGVGQGRIRRATLSLHAQSTEPR